MYKYKLILIFCLALIAVSVSGCETAGVSAKKNIKDNYQSKEIILNKKVVSSQKNLSTNNMNEKSYNDPIKIGLMLPLSGEHYRIGRSLLNASQMALEQINENN